MQVTILPSFACNYNCSYCGNRYQYKHQPHSKVKSEEEWKNYLLMLDGVLKRSGSKIKEIIFNGGEPTLLPWFSSFCNWILYEQKWLLTVYTNLSNIDVFDDIKPTRRLIIRTTYHHEDANALVFGANWQYLDMKYNIEASELGERRLERVVITKKRTTLKKIYNNDIDVNRADTLRVGPDLAIYLTCWDMSVAHIENKFGN